MRGFLNFSGKKVLIAGLGRLGGGVAATRWFVAHGADVTVTDLRSREDLEESVALLGDVAGQVRFVLGEHKKEDFRGADVVVVNPGVPRESKFLKIARDAGAELVNDALMFFNLVQNPLVAVTGTRGKTTTTNWIRYFLREGGGEVQMGGNTPDAPFFSVLDAVQKMPRDPVVVELSSWQLEFLDRAERGPDVAVITNIYRDHLNRYVSMEEYAGAKANVFARQTAEQSLVLNYDSAWTAFFLEKNPKSRVYFFSMEPLPQGKDGVFVGDGVLFRENGEEYEVFSAPVLKDLESSLGRHNIENLLAALCASLLMKVTLETIVSSVTNLQGIPYREEVVYEKGGLVIVNDTTATMPDATIAALRRFSREGTRLILIAGGTDKELLYDVWAGAVQECVEPGDLLLLEGSATKKMIGALGNGGVSGFTNLKAFGSLEEIVKMVAGRLNASKKTIVLFSPGAASFEKFRHEFDRGEQFNKLVNRFFG
jgi:UDP-N-acetylmuramoylalanine--D-glutamate ligase